MATKKRRTPRVALERENRPPWMTYFEHRAFGDRHPMTHGESPYGERPAIPFKKNVRVTSFELLAGGRIGAPLGTHTEERELDDREVVDAVFDYAEELSEALEDAATGEEAHCRGRVHDQERIRRAQRRTGEAIRSLMYELYEVRLSEMRRRMASAREEQMLDAEADGDWRERADAGALRARLTADDGTLARHRVEKRLDAAELVPDLTNEEAEDLIDAVRDLIRGAQAARRVVDGDIERAQHDVDQVLRRRGLRRPKDPILSFARRYRRLEQIVAPLLGGRWQAAPRNTTEQRAEIMGDVQRALKKPVRTRLDLRALATRLGLKGGGAELDKLATLLSESVARKHEAPLASARLSIAFQIFGDADRIEPSDGDFESAAKRVKNHFKVTRQRKRVKR